MKKNALLTFLFACIPGAGQMYYGYMQRGLALISLFCVTFLLGSLAGPLVVTMGIVWMYSFFDTYDLIRHLAAGDPKPDGLLLLGDWSDLKTLVPKHNRLLGWGLIVLGVWALYDLFIENLLYELLARISPDLAWSVVGGIPTVVVAAALIAAGIWLLGLHPQRKDGDNGLPVKSMCGPADNTICIKYCEVNKMEENKTAAPNAAENAGHTAPAAAPRPKKVRRVGTVAFALLLIAAGILLLVQQFVPDFDLLAIVRFAPVLLIVLGVEMLVYSAKPDVKVKFDWLSVIGCTFILCIVGGASVLPYLWSVAGPERSYAQGRYTSQIQDQAYRALNADTDLKAKVTNLYANVYFQHMQSGGYTLQDGDEVYLHVVLPQNGYTTAQAFAEDAWNITRLLEQADVPVTNYSFSSYAADDGTGNGYTLDFLPSFAEGLTAGQLAQRVQSQYQFEGDVYDTQADRDNAVKAILREEVITAFQDANNGEYPGEDTIRQEVEQRFAELYPQPAAQDAEAQPAATPETAA